MPQNYDYDPARLFEASAPAPQPPDGQQGYPADGAPAFGQGQTTVPQPPVSTVSAANLQAPQPQPVYPSNGEMPFGQGQAAAPQPPASVGAQQGYQAPGYRARGDAFASSQAAYRPAPVAPAGQAAYAAPANRKGRGWIVAIVTIVCLSLLAAFCVKSCSDAMSGMTVGSYGAVDGPAGDSVAVITLDGTIQYDGSACSPEGFKQLLDEASSDDNIKALVLRVNSGGGTATAGEEMASYLRDFEKPVVVSSASINASAAYEISAQADYIFVAKSTEIGAIGTAMELTDLSGLLDMLGVNMEVITSADSKDSSYGYRPLTDEERAYYQDMVNQINDMFVENVAVGRDMTMDEVRALATGLAYTGVDAVGNGLADEVGTLEDAADKAAELAGIDDYELYDLDFSGYYLFGLADLLGSSNGGSQLAIPLLRQ